MKKRAFGKLYKELFYIPKHEKLTEKVFRCRMAISLLTMLACTAVLITSTWAWFNMSVTTQPSTIETAYYSVTVDNAENGVYICPLTYEDKHTFEIEAGGTATTGYCKIQVGEQSYYTEQIPQGSSLLLTVQAARGTVITFTSQWGSTNELPCGNEIIHSVTPSATYTIEPTARLSSIAAHYGVTEEDILIYNNLLVAAVAEEETAPLLPVGIELKIPNPAENTEPYKVPYATYIVEPTATLANIAAYYDVSETDILLYNNISEISVNMSLYIPGVAADTTSYAVPFATYTVEATATLEGISEYYRVSANDILAYNGITELTAGNVILIPGVSPDTPSYVAPAPEPLVTVEELAVLYPTDNDYYLISESTITLKNADILLYKGHEYETVEDYQKDLDRRITGIEAVADVEHKEGEYFCKLVTQTETLSLCLEITENIEQGYLKIIIGESEYYTVQIKRDAYIRLDVVAPIGTEIRFEAYEGISEARLNDAVLYGDNIKDDTDGNNPLLNHTLLISQITAEQPAVETTATEETSSVSEQPVTQEPVAETPAIEETTTVTEQPTTEQPVVETPTTEETPSVTEQPTAETFSEETTPTEETPKPDDTTPGGEDNSGELLTEETSPADEDVPTDTGATE